MILHGATFDKVDEFESIFVTPAILPINLNIGKFLILPVKKGVELTF